MSVSQGSNFHPSTSNLVEPMPPSERRRKRARKSNRAAPMSKKDKVLSVVQLLEQKNLDIRELLQGIGKHHTDTKLRKYWLQFRKFAYADMLDETSDLPHLDSNDWDKMLKSGGYEKVHHELRKELVKLAKDRRAARWQYPGGDDMGYIDGLDSLVGVVQDMAPNLLRLLNSIARPSSSSAGCPMETEHKQIMWVTQFLYSMQARRCNGFPRTLALYLLDAGAKKRSLNVLSKLGVTVSSHQVQDTEMTLAKLGADEVRIKGNSSNTITTYDNFDFVEHRSGERLGDKKTQRGITTALQFAGVCMPATGLRQNMWRPRVPIRVQHIVSTTQENIDLVNKCRKHFINKALMTTFPQALQSSSALQHCQAKLGIPSVQKVHYSKTCSYPIAPIIQNEGTTEGNLLIHENIEETQLGNDTDNSMWDKVLKPYYGDLRTVERILAIQNIRSAAKRPFDSRRWIIPGLGLWHLRYNFLQLIHRMHWGGTYPMDSSTLQYAADHLKRSNVNTPADFAKTEALLVHSYYARVSAIMISIVKSKYRHKLPNPQRITSCLKKLRRKAYLEILRSVLDKIYTSSSQAPEPPLIENEVMENHLRFIRHMDIYFRLRHAIRVGDIGLLRYALQDTCVVFQAPEGSTPKYAAELIRLCHLYCSDAATVELQDAMLANSLVNLQGAPDKCFETDRLLEYLNGTLKDILQTRRSSTKAPDNLLKEIALMAPYMLRVRVKLHEFLDLSYRGNHPEKIVTDDLQIMTMDIHDRDIAFRNQQRFSNFVAIDLIRSGAACLGSNVDKYNEKIQKGGEWEPEISTQIVVERADSPTTQMLQDTVI